MSQKIKITSGELYVLGKILKARYIDYAYVAAMEDVGVSYELFEKETISRLVAKGVLEEDFSGNVIPTEAAVSTFAPIFFGQKETSLEVCYVREPTRVEVYKFHFLDGQLTKVIWRAGELEVELMEESDLTDFVGQFFGGIKKEKNTLQEDFNIEDVNEFIALKANNISVRSVVETYMELGGFIYHENELGTIENIGGDDFIIKALNILGGTM